ncbi:MAG: type II restriction endonuclease, partial [Sphingobacteriales bacterium]|nr:type II restriction endonuclease [Sphingobacteriales bacterium]
MKLFPLKPSAALNEAYRKQSLNQEQIKIFKQHFHILFSRINESESEEYNKNIIADFLKDTYYKGQHEINTNERKDLVIHTGPKASDSVGVIIETKKPGNKAEMITAEKPTAKALYELIHYYLHERVYKDNKEIKHLIVTNVYEWFVFDAQDFEKLFYQNKDLLKAYKAWHDGVLVGDKTEWLYNQLLKPFVEKSNEEINAAYFNLKKFEKAVNNHDKADDEKLVDLYKILSSEHLLKKTFANDSNSLNKEFYNELLHIIGLEEKKEGSKKLIDRKPITSRNDGSLLENTINILQSRTAISEAELFSTALELCINWLNRILFLKLMEGQLIQYHRGNKKDYSFLNAGR